MTIFHKAEASVRQQIGETIKGLLQKDPAILFAFVFGSFLESIAFRDIDVGIFVKDRDQSSFTDLELTLSRRIEEALSEPIPVDVRVINRAPLPFRFRVIRGKLLFSKADDVLEEFMVATARQYLDSVPLRERYLREVIAS